MKKYVIAGLLSVIFLVVILLSFNKSSIEYTDFQTATDSGKRVQVVGSWVREMATDYKPESNLFSFYMKDKKGKVVKVIHSGPQPNNFSIAKEFVVQGYMKGSVFYSNQIITKCPSKYEGEVEDIVK